MYGTAHSGVHESDIFIIALYNDILQHFAYDLDQLLKKIYNIFTNGTMKIL